MLWLPGTRSVPHQSAGVLKAHIRRSGRAELQEGGEIESKRLWFPEGYMLKTERSRCGRRKGALPTTLWFLGVFVMV